MGKIGYFVLAILVMTLGTGPAWAAGAIGTWATKEGKSHVTITACGDKLCGTIVWLKEPLNDKGEPKHDANNPDKALQGRPIIGLPLLANFEATDDANYWENGKIYNPEDGEVYSCTLTLVDSDTLEVHGYVGLPLFGKTQVWKRVK